VRLKKIFKWQFSLKDKAFDYDPLLPAFLGFPAQKKISLQQLFNCFDSLQVIEIRSAFKDVLSTQTSYQIQTLMKTLNHRYLVDFSISSVEGQDNIIAGNLVYLELLPNDLQENKFLRKMFLNSETGRMVATSDHIIIMANKAFCKEVGYAEHELIGKSAKILKSGHYEPEFYVKLWETVNTAKVWCGELLAKDRQGEVYARDVKIQRYDIDDGSHFYFTSSVALDLPTSVLNVKINENNEHSNVPDKEKYTRSLQQCYKGISKEQTIVVATFSINWLQKISDFTACWLVAQRFHLTDQPGTLGIISKGIYSLYWVEDKNPDKIDMLLRKLMKAFSYGFDDSSFDLFSTVNMGVSILLVDAKNTTQLISHSTQTLIANPTREYSSLYYFDPRLAKRFDRHQVLTKVLKKALDEKSIDVYYQPVVSIPELKIVEFEALFRIKLETQIDYTTLEIIHIAETYNWIDEIDAIVTKTALTALPKIQRHYGRDDIGMAINRSLASDKMTHCCLKETIDILLAAKVDLTQVTIELTESAIFDHFDQQKHWIEILQSHGVKVAIDDFAASYSSFTYLNNLPFNFIKIDRSFVGGITLDSTEYTMIKMLCKVAHKMGAQVIAEGVETLAEFALLSRANVDILQGHIFSKPMSLETLLGAPAMPFSAELVSNLYQRPKTTIADICSKTFKRVDYDDRLYIIRELVETGEYEFFLIFESKRCIGILYRVDYCAAISPYINTDGEQKRDLMTLDKRVHQVMKKDFLALHIDDEMHLAEQYFVENPYAVIIVVNDEDSCLGVVTVQTLLSYQQAQKANPLS